MLFCANLSPPLSCPSVLCKRSHANLTQLIAVQQAVMPLVTYQTREGDYHGRRADESTFTTYIQPARTILSCKRERTEENLAVDTQYAQCLGRRHYTEINVRAHLVSLADNNVELLWPQELMPLAVLSDNRARLWHLSAFEQHITNGELGMRQELVSRNEKCSIKRKRRLEPTTNISVRGKIFCLQSPTDQRVLRGGDVEDLTCRTHKPTLNRTANPETHESRLG